MLSNKITHLWRIYKLDSSNIRTEVLLPNNPTIYSAQLAVTPNVLSYDLHVFVYEITMAANLGNQNFWYYKSSAESYFEIVPSGLVVFGLQNGNADVYIGYNQKIELNAIKYSYDMDNLMPMEGLKFEFYCRNYLSLTLATQNVTQFQSSDTNLKSIQNLGLAQSAQFCFSSSSRLK